MIDAAREACVEAGRVVDQLHRTRRRIDETIRYLLWWQFLGYDERATDFLDKLEPPVEYGE